MAQGLNILVNIQQKLSGQNAAAGLAKTNSAIAKTTSAIRALETAKKRLEKIDGVSSERLGKLDAAISKHKSSLLSQLDIVDEVASVSDQLEQVNPGGLLAKGFGLAQTAASALLSVVKVLATAAIAIGVAFTAVAVKVGKAIFEAARFNTDIEFALTKFLGSAEASKKEIAEIRSLANRLGLDYRSAANDFKQLVSAGFTAEASKELLAWKADLIAIGGGSDEVRARVQSAFDEIGKSMASGRMEADGFNRVLENLPITKAQVMAKLAPKMGKSVEDLMKMDITKLPIDKLIAAMQEAFLASQKAGKTGEVAADKIRSSWTGALDAMKARFGNLVYDLADRLGPTINKTITSIMKKFDGFDLGGILDKVVEFFEGVMGEADKIDLSKILDSVGEGIKDALNIAKKLLPVLSAAFKGLFGGFLGGMDIMGPTDDLMTILNDKSKLEGLKTTFAGIGTAVGVAAAAVVKGITTIMEAMAEIGNIANTIKGWLSGVEGSITGSQGGMGAAAAGLGVAIVKGLIGGITGNTGMVMDAVRSIATNAVNAGKGALGISSPSRVFAEMGAQTAAGFSQGINAGAPDVGRTVDSMLSTPTVEGRVDSLIQAPQARAPQGGSQNGGGGRSTTLQFGDIVINGVKDGREAADAFIRQLTRALNGIAPMAEAT